jgi:hypothetical protein
VDLHPEHVSRSAASSALGRSVASSALGRSGRLFSVCWGFALLLHVLGNPTLASPASNTALALAIALVLLVPGEPLALGVLSIAQLATVWSEAPVLANHWALAAAVSVAVLLALATRGRQPERFWSAFLPAARWCLLGFYAFAAFAKLNHAFFDPDVSCAPFYLHESARSLGIGALSSLSGWGARVVIVATAATELSIPVLLAWRRTRVVWVPVAMAFHLVLALDRVHEFFDFSAVLFALFVLFLPNDFAGSLGEWLLRVPRALSIGARVIAAALVVWLIVAASNRDLSLRTARLSIGWTAWQVVAIASLAGVTAWVVRHRPVRAEPGALALEPVMVLVPLLVVLNGLTPYLEVKTAFGWNMYSNLRTVGGDSNHFVIPATAPLLDDQKHLVQILDSDDAGLRFYADHGYALTLRRLRGYLHDHPDTSLTMRLDGHVRRIERAGDHPELVTAVPEWQRKLVVHRAVDLQDPPRCQDVFGPAA